MCSCEYFAAAQCVACIQQRQVPRGNTLFFGRSFRQELRLRCNVASALRKPSVQLARAQIMPSALRETSVKSTRALEVQMRNGVGEGGLNDGCGAEFVQPFA